MFKKRSLFHLILVGAVLLGNEVTFAQTAPNRSFNPDSAQIFFKPPSDKGMPDTVSSSPAGSRVLFQPPPDEGMPDQTSTSPAGSRNGSQNEGQCPQDAVSNNPSEPSLMMAVVPNNSYGSTFAARPSFFVYLPKTSAREIILSLKNKNKHHSQTVIPISGEAGIIKIELGKDAPDLEIGTEYVWTVVLVCGDKTTPDSPGIAAKIRRIDASKQNNAQIKQKSPLNQAIWYGEQGIWYDTLTALADAKSAEPNNQAWEKNWEDLLKSVGLEAIATEPRRF